MRAFLLLVVVGGCGRAPLQDVLDLPAHAAPEGDAGVVDGGPDATCATGDGCFAACPLLDADCPAGATCPADGLCTTGCFVTDPDCTPLDDGVPCAFGEECASGRCTFIDDAAYCTRACGTCAAGLQCVRRADRDESLCAKPSCAAGGLPGIAALAAILWVRRRPTSAP